MSKATNITGTNTRITMLSDIIQKARLTLVSDNSSVSLSSDETRQIVLVCLLLLRTEQSNQLNSTHLSDALCLMNLSVDCCFDLCTESVRQIELGGTIKTLMDLKQCPDWRDLLNYALEALEYNTNEYFKVKVSGGARRANIKKKNQGVYYTPIDVVDFMVSRCISSVSPHIPFPTIIDFSCGSGVFLLQSFLNLEKKLNPNHCFDTSVELLTKCIWGVDISQAAIDCCKAVFLQYYIDEYSDDFSRFFEVGYALRHSLFVGDATQLQIVYSSHKELPQTYNCIIGNPPYVSEGKDSNLFIPFVENLITHSSGTSCSALVLPLSVCYSQGRKYVELRERMSANSGEWIFLNYDRSPDSLFGDQVKTRNTILFHNTHQAATTLTTTRLQRWTSEHRDQLFKKQELCDISNLKISKYVPKISCPLEKQAFEVINRGHSSLKELCVPYPSEHTLVVNGTAYNWICAYDHFPPSTDEKGNPYLSNTSKIYYFPDEIRRDFCIALLSNRIAYWYWVAIGDGFHLNSSFLSDYRVSWNCFTALQQEELCKLGNAYSQRVKDHPTVSFNAGKKIVNYSHWDAMEIIRRVEEIIIAALNLPTTFASYIEDWYHNQVYCNRDNEKR